MTEEKKKSELNNIEQDNCEQNNYQPDNCEQNKCQPDNGEQNAEPAILLAVYNGEDYLEEMLTSLQGQTWKNFICYIHDDGSTDRSPDIEREWAERDSRFRILEGPATGSSRNNFLWMMKQVQADYYMFADHDDVWLPDKIERSMDLLTSDSELTAVFTDMYVTDANLNIKSESFIRDLGRDIKRTAYTQLIIDNLAAGCTMLFRRSVRDAAILLQDPEQIEVHDEWVITLAASMGKVEGIDKPLVYYRQHGSNEVGASRETFAHKAGRNLKDLINGSYLKNKNHFIDRSRKLAGQLALIEAVPEAKRRVLKAYSEIGSRPKKERIRFYRKFGFSRNKGNSWMELWI